MTYSDAFPQVTYTDANGEATPAVVLAVHHDCPPLYYTVKLATGQERETVGSRLQPVEPASSACDAEGLCRDASEPIDFDASSSDESELDEPLCTRASGEVDYDAWDSVQADSYGNQRPLLDWAPPQQGNEDASVDASVDRDDDGFLMLPGARDATGTRPPHAHARTRMMHIILLAR